MVVALRRRVGGQELVAQGQNLVETLSIPLEVTYPTPVVTVGRVVPTSGVAPAGVVMQPAMPSVAVVQPAVATQPPRFIYTQAAEAPRGAFVYMPPPPSTPPGYYYRAVKPPPASCCGM